MRYLRNQPPRQQQPCHPSAMGFVGRYRGYRPIYLWAMVTGGLCGVLAGVAVEELVQGLVGRSAAD